MSAGRKLRQDLNVASVGRACDAFFRRRGMVPGATGAGPLREQIQKSHDNNLRRKKVSAERKEEIRIERIAMQLQ